MKVQWLLGVLLFVAAGCSNQIAGIYDQSEGFDRQEEDVIDTQEKVENTQYLDDFIQNINDQQEDEVRIVSYTSEGNPVFTYLTFDGSEITFQSENSDDTFVSGETIEKTCENFERKDRVEETVYQLECGKKGDLIDVLTLPYDAAAQDQFEFKFSYDKGNHVVVDTLEQSLSIQADSSSLKQENFKLTEEESNKIYKLFIKGNYQQRKDLSGSCREDREYSLKVVINASEKRFEWSSCDSGEDVEDMNELAEEMIAIIEETRAYRKVFE
ncbi:DUF4362 domain-containing protein [Halobacillus sp. A5]|uniref:DUF4362 domain-containing protein n=1 Tax=Halobacillus sp. A5 TaxID=2880263 RepID=UPI0020A6389E|nr:DUF4362 domain-containing protein [Halobacillus sp. A5]MCP3029395.1 DUF4362 domain-containing protein [Halobacillus sp. A5]